MKRKTGAAVAIVLCAAAAAGIILYQQGFLWPREKITGLPDDPNLPINAPDVQRAISTSNAFASLGPNTRILIRFYNASGMRNDIAFLIGQGGSVIRVHANMTSYDVMMSTSDHYIPQIETTTDICALLRQIKNSKDFNVQLNTDLVTAGLRYGSLASCVPLS